MSTSLAVCIKKDTSIIRDFAIHKVCIRESVHNIGVGVLSGQLDCGDGFMHTLSLHQSDSKEEHDEPMATSSTLSGDSHSSFFDLTTEDTDDASNSQSKKNPESLSSCESRPTLSPPDQLSFKVS